MLSKIAITILTIAVVILYISKFLERSPDLINAEITTSAVPGLQKKVAELTNKLECLELKPESGGDAAIQWDQMNRLNKLEVQLVELKVKVDLLKQAQLALKQPLTEPDSGRRNVPEGLTHN